MRSPILFVHADFLNLHTHFKALQRFAKDGLDDVPDFSSISYNLENQEVKVELEPPRFLSTEVPNNVALKLEGFVGNGGYVAINLDVLKKLLHL